MVVVTSWVVVSIHRPHTRPDSLSVVTSSVLTLFQFTGLIRGPTLLLALLELFMPCFNSQASYEARLRLAPIGKPARRFQFTGLIRGPTKMAQTIYKDDLEFQFTGLIRGPTKSWQSTQHVTFISIHRPHTRPDY